MDIGGVNRVKPLIPSIGQVEIRGKAVGTSADRDAAGHSGYQQREKPKQLSPEQEEQAVAALNALPSFAGSGLTAALVREEGKPPHVIVKDKSGTVVRHLPYEQIVELYLKRNSENQTGRLLNRAA